MARPSLQAVGQNAIESFQRMTGPQRVTLGLAFAATAIGVFLVAQVTSSTPMGTLAADLEPDVAADVTAALEARGVPYELMAGGRVIQVPVDQVHDLRLDLVGQDVLGNTDGWTVLDDQGITSSAFDQRVGYQRAMEGELANTISSINAVRSANVHLVIPESDLFLDDEQMASASVLVDTGSQTLSAMQVQAVINLVASSVEGLTPGAVSLADQTGQVLAAPGGASAGLDLVGEANVATRVQFERSLAAKVENLLRNVVGPGFAIVEVSAELDFDTSTQTTESVNPILTDDGEQARVSETVKQEFYRSEIPGAEEGGELEIELPDDIDIDGDGAVDENVIYVDNERQFDAAFETVVSSTQNAPGAVRDLSVSVLMDDSKIVEDQLAAIETMVGAAVGLDPERGDTLAVNLLPFDESITTALEEAAEDPVIEAGGLDLVGLIRTVGTVVIALLVVLLALRFLARNPRRRVIESVELNELEAGAAAALEAGSTEEEEEENLGEPPEVRLQHLIANQTDDVAGVLRSWLNEAEEVGV